MNIDCNEVARPPLPMVASGVHVCVEKNWGERLNERGEEVMPGERQKWGFRGRGRERRGWMVVKEGGRATVKCQHQQ